MSAGQTQEASPPTHKWLVTAAVMLAAAMEVIDTSIANVALPHIQGSLSASVDEITWVLTSYLVANAIVIPLGGWFSEIFGRKNFFNGCVVIFTGASVACGAAPNLETLVFFRIVQGAAGGALIPLSQAIMMETFPPKEQGMAMAMWGVGIMVAPVIGPYLGGWITDSYSWRWIFYVNVPVGILTFVLVGIFVHEPEYLKARRGKAASDWWGLGFLVLGVGALQMMLDLGQRRDWFTSDFIVLLTLLSVAGTIAFILRELMTRNPLIDLRLFTSRSYSTGVFLMGAVGFVLYASIFLVPLHAQNLLGYSALETGKVLAPMGIATLFTMPIAGVLVNRVDARLLLTFGTVLLACSAYMLAGLTLDAGFWHLTVPRIVQGFALGFIFVPLTTATMTGIALAQTNAASGFFNLARNIGGSVGIALAGTFISRRSQFHQQGLVENLTSYGPNTSGALDMAARVLAERGIDPGLVDQGALSILYAEVQRQARMNAFLDDYWMLALIALLTIPLILLLKKPDPTAGTMGH